MRRLYSTLVLIFFASLSDARAILVDWSTEAWTPGTLSNSYNVDPANVGNDVTITVTGDTNDLGLSPTGPQTPAITSALEGGFSPAHVNLEMYVDFKKDTNAITVTLDFSALYAAGVANVSFNIFDIDFANQGGGGAQFQDVIRSISATSITGALIAPTITVGPNVILTGSGLGQVISGAATTNDTGLGSGDANATITFNALDIRSVTFTYGSGSFVNNPTDQHIGIDNILYAVVPEFDPTWVTLIVCGSLVVGTTVRRRQKNGGAKKHIA
jgi:hypothetical protein